MGRRILNRKDLRADFDAAERRQGAGPEGEENELEEEEEGEEVAEGEADETGDDEDDESPKPKKKKAAVKIAKPKRTRTAKVPRLKVVWGVFNNSSQRVATYDYAKRKEADEHAARLMTDKKTTHFVQPVKEPLEEKA